MQKFNLTFAFCLLTFDFSIYVFVPLCLKGVR
jgi:hypothetical protein